MKLKFSYQTLEEIEEAYRGLYTEQDGQFVLTGIDGVKSQADLDRSQGALNNERDAHKQTKTELQQQLEAIRKENEELKKANPKPADPTPKPIDKSTDPNVLALQAQMQKQAEALETLQKQNEELEAEKRKVSILETLRKSATGKVRQEALSDLELYAGGFNLTDDGKVVTTDGTSLDDWMIETLKSKPHWLPENKPGGATGGNGGGSDLTLDAKKAKLGEITKKDSLSPVELAEAHALATEIKNETAKV